MVLPIYLAEISETIINKKPIKNRLLLSLLYLNDLYSKIINDATKTIKGIKKGFIIRLNSSSSKDYLMNFLTQKISFTDEKNFYYNLNLKNI